MLTGIFVAGVFLSTLISHYFYNLGCAAFTIAGLLLISLSAILLPTKRSSPRLTKAIYALLLFAISTTVVGIVTTLAHGLPVLYARLAIPLVGGATIFSISHVAHSNPTALEAALRFSLHIHVGAFFAQLITFAVTGNHIDFVEPLTGESQRVFGGSYESPFALGYIRCSGLLSEPGTYANIVAPIYFAKRMLTSRTASETPNEIIDGLVITSLLLSLSVYGFIFAIVGIINFGIMRSKILGAAYALITAIIIVAIYDWYLLPRFSNNAIDSGTGFRLEMARQAIETSDIVQVLFGWGITSNLDTIFPETVLNDSSLLLYTYVTSGALGIILLTTPLLSSWTAMPGTAACTIFVLLVSKLSPTYIIFWILCAVIVICTSAKRAAIQNIIIHQNSTFKPKFQNIFSSNRPT